jgi:maltokinase
MTDLTPLYGELPDFLGRQRWFAGAAPDTAALQVILDEELVSGWPELRRLVVDAAGVPYQLLVGIRPEDEPIEFLHHRDDAVLGRLENGTDCAVAYDAILDADLALALLGLVTDGGEKAAWVRPVTVEQSNTSLIYEDRLILKLFRRLHEGEHPEAAVSQALDDVGFNHLAEPLAVWRRDGTDLALLQPYLAGGTEGWALALASLRDLYGTPGDPGAAGGDFAAEAERLGQLTGRLHLAMAEAFGTQPADPASLVVGMRAQLEEVGRDSPWHDAAAQVFDRFAGLSDAGRSIRVHGDFHLGQVMRTEVGWFVLDFEGEPARPLEDRRRPTSPLKDATGMLRSFHYATEVVLSERDAGEREHLVPVAEAWEERNRRAFLLGYQSTKGIDELLPRDATALVTTLAAFELDKAIYEVAYERAHRPAWEAIPVHAIERLVHGYYPSL